MEAPCCTKIIKSSADPTLNFLETLQSKGRNLFVMSLMQRWKMNETKAEWNLLLAFHWLILKMKFFGRINNAKGKHPTPGQFCLFSFLAGKRQSWAKVVPKWWAKSILFQCVIYQQFFKWIIFGYGEICVQYCYTFISVVMVQNLHRGS